MSKTRCVTFETYDNFDCTLSSIAELLNNAGWRFTLNIYDQNGDDVWSRFCGTYDEFLQTAIGCKLVEIAHADGQTAELCIKSEHSFTVFLSSYIKMTGDGEQYVDFNWYYDNMVNNFNRPDCIIERVTFEEYL